VCGQIITFESRRGEKMFERYGFKVLNRAEITKYKAFYPESVYLSTVSKNLETARPTFSLFAHPRIARQVFFKRRPVSFYFSFKRARQ
jgi:hypothetical protein